MGGKKLKKRVKKKRINEQEREWQKIIQRWSRELENLPYQDEITQIGIHCNFCEKFHSDLAFKERAKNSSLTPNHFLEKMNSSNSSEN